MRELDEEIAEKVMGLSREDNSKQKCRCDCRGYTCAKCQYPPHYSTDIAAAWTVVEKLRVHGEVAFSLVTASMMSEGHDEWVARFDIQHPKYHFEFAFDKSAPLAICKAALKAVKGGEDA